MKKRVVLRADGNSTIGLGHVYRLLALADMLRPDYEIIFVIAGPDDFLKETIMQYVASIYEISGSFVYTAPDVKRPEEEMPYDLTGYLKGDEIVVLDGYWFGSEYQKAIKTTGAKLVCIDDFAQSYFYADVVINHAPGIHASQYIGEPHTKYYLGLDYALLRKDFFKPFDDKRQSDSLLISMGGSDHYEITEQALEAAIHSGKFNTIHTLVSSSFSSASLDRINNSMQHRKIKIQMHKNLSASILVDLMDRCTFALVSASTILLECYSRGMNCFTGHYINNQVKIYEGFTLEHRAKGLGDLKRFRSAEGILELSQLIKTFGEVNNLAAPLKSYINLKEVFKQLSL